MGRTIFWIGVILALALCVMIAAPGIIIDTKAPLAFRQWVVLQNVKFFPEGKFAQQLAGGTEDTPIFSLQKAVDIGEDAVKVLEPVGASFLQNPKGAINTVTGGAVLIGGAGLLILTGAVLVLPRFRRRVWNRVTDLPGKILQPKNLPLAGFIALVIYLAYTQGDNIGIGKSLWSTVAAISLAISIWLYFEENLEEVWQHIVGLIPPAALSVGVIAIVVALIMSDTAIQTNTTLNSSWVLSKIVVPVTLLITEIPQDVLPWIAMGGAMLLLILKNNRDGGY